LALALFATAANAWPYGYGSTYGRSYSRYSGNRYGASRYGVGSRYSYGARFGYGSPYAHAARYGYATRYGHRPYTSRAYVYPYRYSRTPYYGVARISGYRPGYAYGYRSQLGYLYSTPRSYLVPSHPYAPGYSIYSSNIAATNQTPASVVSGDAMHALNGPGWALFERGQAAAALDAFAEQATSNPIKGGPKIGYALSAAQLGDLTTGVWAMRRACEIDSHALHYVALTDSQTEQVKRLAEQYSTGSEAAEDRSFMAAALHYLSRDLDTARAKIDEAMALGDTSQAAALLKKLIAERNAEHITARPLLEEAETSLLPQPAPSDGAP
jgi:hypothetical protein